MVKGTAVAISCRNKEKPERIYSDTIFCNYVLVAMTLQPAYLTRYLPEIPYLKKSVTRYSICLSSCCILYLGISANVESWIQL